MYSLKACNLESMVCRISTEGTQGSGIIINIEKDLFYIFTCFHVIEGARRVKVEQLINQNIFEEEIELTKENFYFSKENDTAIIAIKNSESSLQLVNPKLVCIAPNNTKESYIVGFPEVKNRGRIEFIEIDRVRSEGHKLRTDVPLETFANDANENCKGFSGGAVYIKHCDYLYLYGIVQKFSNEFKHFTYLSIEQFNELLCSNSLNPLSVLGREVIACNTILISSKNNLTKVSCSLKNDIEFDRSQISERIILSNKKISIVTGEPGIGKSAILKNISKVSPDTTFYFRAENFTKEILGEFCSILELSKLMKVYIIIDSCEKIFDLNYEEFFLEALKLVSEVSSIKLYFGIRSYSLKNLKRILFSNFQIASESIIEEKIESISNEELNLVFSKFPKLKNLKSNTILLIKNPFYLDMVLREKLSLDRIDNEFQIKDLIFESITSEDAEIQQAVIDLIRIKLNSKNEYIPFSGKHALLNSLCKKEVLFEKNLHYKFSHDKIEDIASKKYFDFLYMTESCKQIVGKIETPLAHARPFRLWIHDRLTNNEIKEVSNDINLLLEDKALLPLWSWSALEAIYESIYFKDYLEVNKEKLGNANFIKKIYELTNSCDLIELKENHEKGALHYSHFIKFVTPSIQIFPILEYFSKNKNLIVKKNYKYLCEMLASTNKFAQIIPKELYTKNFTWLFELVLFLIEKYEELNDYSSNCIKDLVLSFTLYASADPKKSKLFMNKLSSDKETYFNREFLKTLLLPSKDKMELFSISIDFISIFWEDITKLFNVYFLHTGSNRFSSMGFHFEQLYEVEDCYNLLVYPQSTIIYQLFAVDFNKAVDFIISYINEKTANFISSYNNMHPNDPLEMIDFNFEKVNRQIAYLETHFFAYIGNSNSPKVLEVLAHCLMQQLLIKNEKESIECVLRHILRESNNLILNSIVYNLIMLDFKKYFNLFSDIANNFYLRALDIQLNLYLETRLNFREHDEVANLFLADYKKRIKTKKTYDEAFLYLQLLDSTQEKASKILNQLSESDNPHDELFAYNHSLENFTEERVVDGRQYLSPKAPSSKKLVQYAETTQAVANKNILKANAHIELYSGGGKIIPDELFKLIQDGEFERDNFLHPFIGLFLLRNPAIVESYNVLIQDFFENLNTRKLEAHEQGPYLERLLFTITELEKEYFKKYYKEIVRFLFSLAKRNYFSGSFREEQKKHFKKLCFRDSQLLEDMLLLLINVSYFDDELFKAHLERVVLEKTHDCRYTKEEIEQIINLHKKQKNVVDHMTALNKYNYAKEQFEERLFENLWNHKQKLTYVQKESKNIIPENLFVLEFLVSMANQENYITIGNHILTIQEFIINNPNYFKENSLYEVLPSVEYSISNYIIVLIQHNWEHEKFFNHLFEHLEIYANIVHYTLSLMSANIQDGELWEERAWNFYRAVYNSLFKCYELEKVTPDNQITNYTPDYIKSIFYSLCFINHNWISSFGESKIKLLELHKDELLEWIVSFFDSYLGIRVFASILHNYLEDDISYVFKFHRELLQGFINQYAFAEEHGAFNYEMLFDKTYQNHEQLLPEQKEIFYVLITTIGYNAPSAFLLYLKRKIEF